MNRTVIIVKDGRESPSRPVYRLVRLHWEYGEDVENWLQQEYPTPDLALGLILGGHRSTRSESYKDLGHKAKYETYRTLKAAKADWEYITLAYHNGRKWRFERNPDY
jgi:hypothetical protein